MRRTTIALGTVATLTGALLAAPRDQDPAPVPGWHAELAAGFAEARATGRPLMVVFR